MVAYKKLTAFWEESLPPHDPAVAWCYRFIHRVCHAAFQAMLPHEVLKLAVPLFNSYQLDFNVEGLVQQANAVASPSPNQKRVLMSMIRVLNEGRMLRMEN